MSLLPYRRRRSSRRSSSTTPVPGVSLIANRAFRADPGGVPSGVSSALDVDAVAVAEEAGVMGEPLGGLADALQLGGAILNGRGLEPRVQDGEVARPVVVLGDEE